MAKIKKGSRRIVLLAAFVSVMSAAGGLLGAVTGAVVVLLMKSMFNTTTGIAEFMLTMVALGAVMSLRGERMRSNPHCYCTPVRSTPSTWRMLHRIRPA